jgi:hypothetical protein
VCISDFVSSILERFQEHRERNNRVHGAKCGRNKEKIEIRKGEINRKIEKKLIKVTTKICWEQKVFLQV